MSLLQEPIRRELKLSDGQLGALTGLAFAMFYATLAIPFARMTDRTNRKIVVGVSLALWSAMTVLCGRAAGFLTLFGARMGVGVGEAGGYPPSASLLSDYFARDRRATAIAVFGVGAPVGAMLGLFVGGWLYGLFGWRAAFTIMGFAGLLLAPVVLLTVREPEKGAADVGNDGLGAASRANIVEVTKILWNMKSFRYLMAGNLMHGFFLAAYSAWAPPLYGRVFHLPTTKVGLYLGLLAGVGGFGTYFGGVFSDLLGRRNPRWLTWIPALAMTLVVPIAAIQLLAGSVGLSLAMAVGTTFLLYVFVGPTIAIGQSLVLPHMRATTAAITLATNNIFGLGFGPLFVGALSDYLHARWGMGADTLRYAILASVLAEAGAAFLYFQSGLHLDRDLDRDRRDDFPESGPSGAAA